MDLGHTGVLPDAIGRCLCSERFSWDAQSPDQLQWRSPWFPSHPGCREPLSGEGASALLQAEATAQEREPLPLPPVEQRQDSPVVPADGPDSEELPPMHIAALGNCSNNAYDHFFN